MSLVVSKGQISGTLALPDTVVAVEKIIDKTIDATLYSAASKALKDAVFTAGKYRDFTPFVNGVDSTIVVENKHIRVDFSTKGGAISQVTLKDYDAYSANKQEKEDQLVMFDAKTNDYGFILNSTDQRFDTKELYFAPSMPNDSTVVMTLNLANGAHECGVKLSLKDNGVTREEFDKAVDDLAR
ncbi:MAG: YidC/Oxa1 family insertase periplasmic-domain containing protein [Bacteroidales bacterium]|nr:YidC/Oxa1 family insertase periplasmic-domain containing protein [Bacteroidales bacterium]